MAQKGRTPSTNVLRTKPASAGKSRRHFLRTAFLATTGAAAIANGGCIILPAIGEIANNAKSDQMVGGAFGPRLPGLQRLPNIRKDWKVLVNNPHLLAAEDAAFLNGLNEEWNSLSYFINPTPLPYGEHLSELQQLVFPVSGEGLGSGTLITPRHILTAAHVVDGAAQTLIPLTYSSDVAPRVSLLSDSISSRPELDLALITLPPGTLPIEGSRPLARLHPRGPMFGSFVYALGYPNRERDTHGYNTSLLQLRGAATLHSNETSRFLVKPVGEQLLTSEQFAYRDYTASGAPCPAGMSGGPISSPDGRILGTFIGYNGEKILNHEPNEILVAAGAGAIQVLIRDYLLQNIARPIQQAADAVRARL